MNYPLLMQDQWQQSIQQRAAEYWTEQRVRSVLGGKRLPFPPVEAAVLLRAIGLMHADGSMPAERIRKYRQINHMFRTLRPALTELADTVDCPILVDAGCGRSYLTMLVAWWFAHVRQQPAQILGLDWGADMVEACRDRAARAGLGPWLRFETASLSTADLGACWEAAWKTPLARLDGLISLHACDTATDDALVIAVEHDASFIAVAPCCQRELSSQWAAAGTDSPFAGQWQSPHLRRTAAATTTDTYRLLLLQAQGYDATATEFIDAVHTPKNTLIRAMKRAGVRDAGWRAYERFRDATGGVDIALAERIRSVESS